LVVHLLQFPLMNLSKSFTECYKVLR